MNTQDEEKARELAIKSTRDIDDKGNEVYNVFVEAALQEMAEWKKKQLIQEAVEWLKLHMPFGEVSESLKDDVIEHFKKQMYEK